MMKEGIDLYPERYKKDPYKLCGYRHCIRGEDANTVCKVWKEFP
jgi:hypothetical protein